MKPVHIAMLAIVAVFYILALALYPQMPAQMATHWNAQGVADGFTSRFWGMFLLPFIVTGVALLLWVVPFIDPRKENIARFRTYYDWFVVFFLLFMLYVDVLTLLWNLDYRFNMTQMIIPGIGVLFLFIGVMVRHAKRNYLIGIRTPWTLANEEVWDRTHRLGGWIFTGAGVLSFAGIFFPDQAIWILLGALLVAVVVTVIYSWWVFQKIDGKVMD